MIYNKLHEWKFIRNKSGYMIIVGRNTDTDEHWETSPVRGVMVGSYGLTAITGTEDGLAEWTLLV